MICMHCAETLVFLKDYLVIAEISSLPSAITLVSTHSCMWMHPLL